MTEMSRSQSKAEYGRFAHLFVGGIEWLLSQWQALTGGGETDLHSHASSGGGVAVPLSVTSSHAIEVLAIEDLGGTTHRQESGQNFSVFHAAEDVAHQYYPFQVGDSGITFNLNDFFNSVLEIRSRSSTSRRLLQAGWNDSAEIILGFATGKVGFFGKTGVTRPQVPASPTVQDVVDALKALGLITQAA
jgi:hypothetical protein